MENKYTCSHDGCNRVFTNEEKNITNSSKCIFHCEKKKENNWFYYIDLNDYDGAKSNWNKEYVEQFWEKFEIYVESFETDNVEINKVIFPIYWERHYNHININKTLESKKLSFKECVFLDRIYIENLNEEKENNINWISFSSNCIFNQDIRFVNFKFKKGMSILHSTFKKELLISCCSFENLFEIVNSKLTNLYLHSLNSLFPIEIKYNTSNVFNLSVNSGNLKELMICGNNINDLEIEDARIDNFKLDSGYPELVDYKFNNIKIIENSKIISLIIDNIKSQNVIVTDSKIEKGDFINSEFSSSELKNNISIGRMNFMNSTFYNNLIVESCDFEELILKKVEVLKEINLSNSIVNKNIECFNLKANLMDRETARMIKNSFDQQNNIIEANKYYALEMKEREKELNQDIKKGKNFFEWLVFKIHGISSNHSQDWILSLLWIINISLIVGLFNQSYYFSHDKYIFISFYLGTLFFIYSLFSEKYRKLGLLSFLMLFYILTNVDLDFVANLLNITTIFNSKLSLTFTGLIYKITIAYLIYQLIISIRQNTRRK